MNGKNTVKLAFAAAIITAAIIAGCFVITLVSQPSSAQGGEQITSVVTVSVQGQSDSNPHYGIVGLLVPNDWTIDTVYFSGGYSDYCTYLDPDSSDAEPGGIEDYWTDTLETRYPSGTDMKWVVYQSSQSHLTLVDTVDVMLTVKMTTSATQGNFNLGYFVSDAALDFTDPTYYDISMNNSITISGTVPVELTSFNAAIVKNGVSLKWETATETNNHGFEIEKSLDNKNFMKVEFVQGNGTTTNRNTYQYVDRNVNTNKYYYRLKQIDNDGSFTYSKTVELNYTTISNFTLSQNYPNPFNPSTSIQFSVPVESQVTVKLFNAVGQEVSILADGQFSIGNHSLKIDASNFSSGTYIYSISAKGADGTVFAQSKKMVLIK